MNLRQCSLWTAPVQVGKTSKQARVHFYTAPVLEYSRHTGTVMISKTVDSRSSNIWVISIPASVLFKGTPF